MKSSWMDEEANHTVIDVVLHPRRVNWKDISPVRLQNAAASGGDSKLHYKLREYNTG